MSKGAEPFSLLVEGWRFLPHSFAIVNQRQLLELVQLEKVRVFHRDLPYFLASWKATDKLMDDSAEAAIRAVPPLPPGRRADAALRISFPYDFSPAAADRQFVFGTADFGCVPAGYVTEGQSIERAMRESALEFITPSRWSREGFLRSGADPARVHVVPHGADTALLQAAAPAHRAAVRASLGLDGFAFLNVGVMTQNKGIDVLLRAFSEVLLRHPGAHLVLKGIDALYPSRSFVPDAARGLTAAQRERVQSRLVYIGQTMSERDMASVYQAADAYVAPYRAEGFNLPVLEAAACGLPVICTEGGPTDDFTTGDFALRIESRRVHDESVPEGLILEPSLDHLIHQMLAVAEDAAITARAQLAGPAHVAGAFTWRHAVARLMNVLQTSSVEAS